MADTILKPMLAGGCTNTAQLRYPVLVTPKLDGIRTLIHNGSAVSRSWKLIPNRYLQAWLSKLPEGLDGELMLPGEQFNVTSSFVMSEDGEPDAIIYYAFDYVKSSLGRSYALRMADLEALTVPKTKVLKLLPVTIHDEKELLQYEERCLKDGYEGVMLRSADGPYKCGRSTEREGYLLKLKRFEDSEAVIVGFEEKQHNGNLAIKDAFGRTERSSHKANLSPMGTLGALIVRDVKTNIEFNIGTGYDDIDRDHLWSQRDKLVGKLVKYKFQPTGIVERPRFPVYLGLRHLDDL